MRIRAISINFRQNEKKKSGLLEKFHQNTKNQADMTDTIVVPRTIFKGYLGIMTGTTLITLGSILSKKFAKASKALSVAGLGISFFGTYAFVRPYVIKDSPGVEKNKSQSH